MAITLNHTIVPAHDKEASFPNWWLRGRGLGDACVGPVVAASPTITSLARLSLRTDDPIELERDQTCRRIPVVGVRTFADAELPSCLSAILKNISGELQERIVGGFVFLRKSGNVPKRRRIFAGPQLSTDIIAATECVRPSLDTYILTIRSSSAGNRSVLLHWRSICSGPLV